MSSSPCYERLRARELPNGTAMQGVLIATEDRLTQPTTDHSTTKISR
jgi:hypothetical protein